MSRRNLAVGLGLASLAGLAVTRPAFAQDASKAGTPKTVTTATPTSAAEKAAADKAAAKSASTVGSTGTAGTPAQSGTALGDATKTMPMEEFSEGLGKDPADTAQRLQKQFGTTTRRLGMVPFWPRGDLKVGMFKIMPYLREGVDYLSNYYRKKETSTSLASPNAHDASWAWINQIGAMADGRVNNNLVLSAQVDAQWLVRFDEGSQDGQYYPGTNTLIDAPKEDTTEFTGAVGAGWTRDAIYVNAGYSYTKRSDPIDTDFENEFNRNEHRTFLTFGLNKDILFGTKLRFEMGASVNDAIGHQTNLEDHDRTESEYYLKASYPLLRDTTRVFGRARYRLDSRESEKINDGYVLGFDAGIEGTIPIAGGESRGLRGRVSVGFDSAFYEDDYYDSNGTQVRNDENTENTNVNIQAIIDYVQSSRTIWSLSYLRGNRFTYHGNYQISDRVELSVEHQILRNLRSRAATYFEYDDPSGRLRQDDNSNPYGSKPLPETSDKGDPYPSTTRFGAGFGLRYAINDFIDADMDFWWDRRNNSVDGYVQHHATAGLTFYLNSLKPKVKDPIGQNEYDNGQTRL